MDYRGWIWLICFITAFVFTCYHVYRIAMTDKKKNGWIMFVPSLDLPKERVSIAYDTHDERGIRYAYGYFQFYNGTCGCFWKDGNEQPKVIKAEDIKYWMPVPSLDVQEEPKSFDEAIQEGDDVRYNEDLGCRVNLSRLKRVAKKEATGKLKECIDNITEESLAKARKQLQEEPKDCMYSKDNYTDEDRKILCEGCEEECEFNKKEEPVSEDLEAAIDNYLATYFGGEKEKQEWPFLKKMAIHFANWQKKKNDYAIEIAHMAGEEEGKNIMKQQMMAKAVDGLVVCNNLTHGYKDILMEIPSYLNVDDKVKVIVIKED